jgi:uncharacterized tellurite resistance protein B-like protein
VDHSIDTYDVKLATTCLLTKVAFADEYLDPKEERIIREILTDFFSIEEMEINKLFKDSNQLLEKSTDIFSFGQLLNQHFTKEDKIDLIGCIFEVAFADGELHHLENHAIKKIAHILNIEHKDLITVKMEIKHFL